MNVQDRIKKSHIAIMQHKVFCAFGSILACGKVRVGDDVPTAATNGWDVIYNPNFIDQYMKSDPELRFLVLHEAMHKAYRHMTTWRKLFDENAMMANAAMDYVINLQLVDTDPHAKLIAMPMRDGKRLGLLDERFRGMHTKQVYDILKQEQEEGGKGGEGGEGFDEHDWDGAQELTADEQKELAREVDQALRQGKFAHDKIVGKGAGGMNRELGELLEPKVNWREVLREYVKSICSGKDASSWRRPNRRFLSSDIYMPTLISERVGHLVIGIDTSGSIGGKELNDFLSEVKSIAEEVMPERVDLLYWDSEVAAHETYEATNVADIVTSTKPAGGGGTSPSCVTRYLKDNAIKPECTIMLTDGYVGSDWGGQWDCPVLWVIVNGNTSVAPVGQTIHVTN